MVVGNIQYGMIRLDNQYNDDHLMYINESIIGKYTCDGWISPIEYANL
jgi:hypothetical protein